MRNNNHPAFSAGRAAEHEVQIGLIRCIFGNPFRPVTIDPAWLSPRVVALAWTIDEERAFERMPELADAHEEAGCHDLTSWATDARRATLTRLLGDRCGPGKAVNR